MDLKKYTGEFLQFLEQYWFQISLLLFMIWYYSLPHS